MCGIYKNSFSFRLMCIRHTTCSSHFISIFSHAFHHRTEGEVEKNIVVSPAALAAAKYLEKTFGTPYEVTYPIVEELVPDMDYRRKKILIVHQQVIGNAMRAEIRRRCQKVNGDPAVDNNAVITVASWFMMKQELSEEGDISLREEDDYMELIKTIRAPADIFSHAVADCFFSFFFLVIFSNLLWCLKVTYVLRR